ncbi:MAG: hypothetical protein MSC31_18905 [Solirubrobacteraceae bacterium MAG38_C4-C5]|nr:hypothetical protein [Candidatus Siliceabacter maunaloa]
MAVLVAALLVVLIVPPVAHAQRGVPNVVPVSDTFRGVTLLSEREAGEAGPASDRYFLVRFIEGGLDRADEFLRLPVEPRMGVPFDVEMGPDQDGDAVAVYSRCELEPDVDRVREQFGARIFSNPYPAYTAGRGCDIYRYDFNTQRESRIEGASTRDASEVLPSIWGDQVAFARVYEGRDGNRGVYPYLYVRPLDGGRSERQPGGSRGTEGLPGPTRLDLYGRRLSFSWNYSTREAGRGGPAGVTELRLDTVGGGNRVLSRARHGDDRAYASYLGPQGYRGRIFYGFGRTAVPRTVSGSAYSMVLLNERLSTGERAVDDFNFEDFLIDVSTEGDTTFLAQSSSEFTYAADDGFIGSRQADYMGW